MTIAIDFDGTCVTHEYPNMGRDIGAVPVLRELTEAGHDLILYTVRDGKRLDEAREWFKRNRIPLMDVNRNKAAAGWNTSGKVHADLYIDDNALGCPIKFEDGVRFHFIDWVKARELLVREGILTK